MNQHQYQLVPTNEWRRIVRILDRIDKEVKAQPRREWITARQFAERTGKSKEQIRGFRRKHPDLLKHQQAGYKGMDKGGERKTRYLYDWTGYQKEYAA